MPKLPHRQKIKKDDAFIEHFARWGYVTKGITYLLLAFLTFRAGLGAGRAENQRRAMRFLDEALLGQVLLGGIAMGLAAYAFWRFYNAYENPEDDKWTKRVSAIFIGLVNLGLAWQAGMLALTAWHDASGDQAVHWSAVMMRYPLGIWAVGVAGVCFAGYGVRQIYRGIISKLDDQLRLHKMDHAPRRSAVVASRFGIAARGLVFLMIGYFLVMAAKDADPTQARDFGDSVQQLRSQPYGHWMLIAMSFGLFSYAVYEFIRARYRHIPTG